MKRITFVVPCYNSAGHMERCIDSLLPQRTDIEIIIVNDGSKDDTGKIADRYAEKYPLTVKAIHQANGGHGEGVNQGIRHATGVFFKVVDSDDWLDEPSLIAVLNTLTALSQKNTLPDMIVCNYSRNHQGTGKSHVVRCKNALPPNRLLTWADVKRFGRYQNLMMHAIIYKTALLKQSGVEYPKHSFYVDCLFSHIPIYDVKTLYYMDVTLYQYLVGQVSQTINKAVVIKNIDQMKRVCDRMIDYYLQNTRPLAAKQEKMLLDDMALIIGITASHLILAGTKEARRKNNAFWDGLKQKDEALYKKMRNHVMGILTSVDNPVVRKIAQFTFFCVDKIYKVN